EDENTDLFWAVRGGGGNFGIAASLEYRLHTVGPMITGGLLCYPLHAARDVLRLFREVATSAPDDLMLAASLVGAPDGSGTKVAPMLACDCGALPDGAAAVRGLKAFGRPVMDTLGPMSYCDLNAMIDEGYPKGALNYWKSHFLPDLTDAAIDAMVDAFERC